VRENQLAVSVTNLVRGLKDMRLATAPVMLAAGIAAALYVFFQIAYEIGEDEIAGIDQALLLAFRDPADITDPWGPPWFEETVAEITSLGGYPILIAVVGTVVGYLLVVRMFGPALYTTLSILVGTGLSQLLKAFYDRTRPDLVDHLVTTHTASFPSGHATMSTIVYLTLAALIVRLVDNVRARIYVMSVAVLVSILVGLSRIYLGVHWPSDVAAGWALGVAWACLSWLSVSALRAMRRR
jgi:undecaprenyl-diphosphatase